MFFSQRIASVWAFVFLLGMGLLGIAPAAYALPSFARQTGQSCVACHAGGQFPELTPYGRLFKLTGYTQGDRGNPLAAMLVADATKTRNNADATGNALSAKDGQFILDYGSVFAAGKITDHLGGFAQFTYTHYDNQDASGRWHGRFGSDNFDLRYTGRSLRAGRDLIWGVTLHNNPSVQDVWNSTPAWGYPYVSTSLGAFKGLPTTPLIEGALAQQVAGLGAYMYLNTAWYAELTAYTTAKGVWSFLSQGNKTGDPNHPLTYLTGSSPYWRLAYTHAWDASNIELGMFGMSANVLPLDANFQPIYGTGSTHYKDLGLDAQYQYILAPSTLTAQLRYIREKIGDDTLTAYGGPASLDTLRAKVSYVYRNQYGVSLALADSSGSADAIAYAGSAANVPNTRMWTPEVFMIPVQNVRVGLQYNCFSRYQGAATNYDGAGRNARDNNTLYLYFWAAF